MAQAVFVFFLFFSAARSVCDISTDFEAKYEPHLDGLLLSDLIYNENLIVKGEDPKVYSVIWDARPAVLKLNFIKNSSYEALFIKEAQILDILKSTPGVVDFYGCVKADKFYFVFLERLSSNLNDSKTSFQKLTLARRINFYKQLAFAVAEVNAKGILHNDLNPDNVMTIDADFSSPKVIGFRLSCFLKDQTMGSCIGGDPFYFAPEKISTMDKNSAFRPNEKMDVWSFLLTIVKIETTKESEMEFFKGMKKACFNKKFDESCYNDLIGNIRLIFREENDSLLKFVLSNLQTDPTKRKTMWQLGQELMLMEIQEPTFDINKVPEKDFTFKHKYPIKKGDEEYLLKTVEQYASSQKHSKLVL